MIPYPWVICANIGQTAVGNIPAAAHRSTRTQSARRKGLRCAVGDGADGKMLELNLVFNPNGAFLPPDQAALELEYKQRLGEDFGISFDNLFTITNAPGGRFGERLLKTGNMDRYMGKLIAAFNPDTLPAMMCRSQISVRWDGKLYDCDFNQAVAMPCKSNLSIADFAADPSLPLKREIAFGNHCYACCAGAGSS